MSYTSLIGVLVAIALLVSACDFESPTYANCRAARDAGVAPIREGDPAYRRDLDRDRDGVACDD